MVWNGRSKWILKEAAQASKVGTGAIMTQFYWSITDGVLKAVGYTILGFASNRFVHEPNHAKILFV